MTTLKITIRESTLQSMGCDTLSNVIGLLRYACDVKGDRNACDQLSRVQAIAKSKGCSI